MDRHAEHLNVRARHLDLGRLGRREPRRAGAGERHADKRRTGAAHHNRLVGRIRGGERRAISGDHRLRHGHGKRMPDDVAARRDHQALAGLQAVECFLQRVGLIAAVGGRGDRHIGDENRFGAAGRLKRRAGSDAGRPGGRARASGIRR